MTAPSRGTHVAASDPEQPVRLQVLGHTVRLTPVRHYSSFQTSDPLTLVLDKTTLALQVRVSSTAPKTSAESVPLTFAALSLAPWGNRTSDGGAVLADALTELLPISKATDAQRIDAAHRVLWASRLLLARRRTVVFCDPRAQFPHARQLTSRLTHLAPCAIEPSGLRLYSCKAFAFVGTLKGALARDGTRLLDAMLPCLVGVGTHGGVIEIHQDPIAIAQRLAQANMRALRGAQTPMPTELDAPTATTAQPARAPRTSRARL